MVRSAAATLPRPARPKAAAVLELLKPITWFPPMWAFGCGLVSGGLKWPGQAPLALAGIILAGPLLCGASQAVNEWFDRDVDALNEPERPIPSGRVPGTWGLGLAIASTAVALLAAAALERFVLLPAALGCALSWAYSAPPIRLKRNGWFGNAAVALSYEGLAWLAGDALARGAPPAGSVVLVAALYSLGAHGIMTLNDFKSIAGDRLTGIRSLPVRLGPAMAARVACSLMLAAQAGVAVALALWQRPISAALLAAIMLAQIVLMPRFLADPHGQAARYNASGTGLFVLGMMLAAVTLRSLGSVP